MSEHDPIPSDQISVSRKLVFAAITLFLVLFVIEAATYVFIKINLDKNELFYDSKPLELAFNSDDYLDYLAHRDPAVGWPRRDWYGANIGSKYFLDSSGARVSPAFPVPGSACVSLYGDSFTAGSGVDDVHAWGNVMAEKLGCRVANYGYGGYGTDQSYLRFVENKSDESDVVILSHMTGIITRNISQWRAFANFPPNYAGWRDLKPRFIVDENGKLQLIPLPTLSVEEFQSAIQNPSSFFPHDFYAPGGPGGLVTAKFPFILTLYRAYRSQFLRNGGASGTWIQAHYDRDYLSDGYRVTKGILDSFFEEARNRGKKALVLFIPHRKEIKHFIKTGEWFSDPLAADVALSGAQVVNVGAGMIDRAGPKEICNLFENPRCGGHFNERGYAMLADIAFEALRGSPAGPHQQDGWDETLDPLD